jgi:hypothetical protein
MSNNQQEILDLIEELNGLRIHEQALLTRLAVARGSTPGVIRDPRTRSATAVTSAPLSETGRFRIGETVTLRNPGRYQSSTGTVYKIGAKYITVQTRKGQIIRAPHNLIKHEI